MFRSTPSMILAASLSIVLALASSPARAQFGGTQDMMLQKQQRLQQQITRGNSQPSQPSSSHTGHSHHPHVNNYYFQLPRYSYGYYNNYPVDPYGYNPYGYPYNNGYGYYGSPYPYGGVYPPRVTVVPHGVPLTADILSGGYGASRVPSAGWEGPAVNPLPRVAQPRVVRPEGVRPEQGQPLAQAPQPGPEDEIQRRVAALKPSTEAGRLRSDELIADGDREFKAQEYRNAAAKYREAITKAPDYPVGHLRAGHAYIATGDYELAVTYLGMGYELARTVERPGFTLTDLYQGNALAKQDHQEALADAILRQPDDGGLLFLAGVTQHYDGRPLQARDYFRRAAQLPGRHQPYAAMFLPEPAEEKAE